MQSQKDDITEAKLLAMGFKQRTINQYVLEVELQHEGKREIIANTCSRGWFCYYQVNNVAASRSYYLMEDVQALYNILSKKTV